MNGRKQETLTGMAFERDDTLIQYIQGCRETFKKMNVKRARLTMAEHAQVMSVFDLLQDVQHQIADKCNPFLNIIRSQLTFLQIQTDLVALRTEYVAFLNANKANIFKPEIFKMYQDIVARYNSKAVAAAKLISEHNNRKAAGLPQEKDLQEFFVKLNDLNIKITSTAFAKATLLDGPSDAESQLMGSSGAGVIEIAKTYISAFKKAFCDVEGNMSTYRNALSEIDVSIQKITESVKAACMAADLFKNQVSQIAALKAKQQQGVFQPAPPAAPAQPKAAPLATPGYRRAVGTAGN